MREIEKLKETILKEYPRLTEKSSFTFKCHKNVSCFNECCGDVNIFLTPYDVIRLKHHLGISSQEFLSKYTISPFDKNLRYPIILLQMNDNEKKNCPFVSADGCQVYEDRPWACRMYPLGLASPGEGSEDLDKEFYFLLQETVCEGHKEPMKWTVEKWLSDQGIDEYNRMGEEFKKLTTHKYFREGNQLSPEKVEMFFMVCYNLDEFRDFVFNSSFLKKFLVDNQTKERIREDDIELLRFGLKWLRFSLFGEETMSIRPEILEAAKANMERRPQ